MNHAAEDSNIGKLDFDCLILVRNGKWTLIISISWFEDFRIGATCGHWRMEILVKVNARLRAIIAQNEDAELEHK
jgi:hypothetical protein